MMDDKLKILFIINPISGIGKKNIIPKLIEENLNLQKFEYQIKHTAYRKHGAEIAHAQKEYFQIIVAVGGDGSVNEIGGALVYSSCALAIIPCGSGNGLARHLKIPLKVKKAIQLINKYQVIKIDTGIVNDKIFLGTCGFSFDALIAQKFDEHHTRGFLSYVRLVTKELRAFKPMNYVIHQGSNQIEKTLMVCAVSNASEFGNGFKISPLSEVNDGKMELVMIEKINTSQLISFAARFFNGTIHKSKKFSSIQIQNTIQINLPNQTEFYFHADGEPLGQANHFKVELVPASLNVLI